MGSLLESLIVGSYQQHLQRPLTIAVVAACPFPAPRGTPIRIQRLSEALAARGHRVHVVTYQEGRGEVANGVTVHRISHRGTERIMTPGPSYEKLTVLDPLLARKLSRVLRAHDVDVIYAHHYEGLLVSALARWGIDTPIVYDAHTMLGSELPTYSMGLPIAVKRFLAERLDRRLPTWSEHVVSVTDRIRDRLMAIGAVPSDRVTVVPNGVELELFGPSRVTSESPRQLIFTGNLAPYQGIDSMLNAFRKILDRRPNVRLTVVAEATLGQYEPLARSLGIRESIDVVPAAFEAIPALLASAHIALNPRVDCDGVPLKLLNYLAASKPVLSFEGSAPGLRHQETAWLAPDGDIDAFANGGLALLDDFTFAERLGQNGRRFVELNHSWNRSAERAEVVFAGVVAGAERRA